MFEPEYISKVSEDSLKDEVHKLLCSLCRRRTNHKVIKSLRDEWEVIDHALQGVQDLLIVQCMGCELYSFCKQSSKSDNYQERKKADGSYETYSPITTEQFPHVNTSYRNYRTYMSMPLEIKEAYEETYKALTTDLFKLGAAGLRLIVELVCLTQGINKGNLQNRIDELQAKGIVTVDMKKLLHNVRLFGNRNLHTTVTPSVFELTIAWDAINTLLEAIYGTQDSNRHYDASDRPF